MKTVFGFFADYYDAARTVDELYRQGFSEDEIQILTEEAVVSEMTRNNRKVEQGQNLVGMVSGRQGMPVSGIGSVVAVGPLTSIFSHSALEPNPVQGGLVGAFEEMGMPEEAAAFYTDGINRAGVVLAVRTDDDRAATAAGVLRRFNGERVGAFAPRAIH